MDGAPTTEPEVEHPEPKPLQGNRAERRAWRKQGVPDSLIEPMPSEHRTDICHGVCRTCGRRKILWLPGRWCEGCLMELATESGELFNEDAIKALGSPQ